MSLFNWDKVTDFVWWDGMPAVLICEEGSSKAFSISDPKHDWREVNFVDVFSEAKILSKSSFHSRLEAFKALP